MGPRAPDQMPSEDEVPTSAANMQLGKTSELNSSSSSSSSGSHSNSSVANLADDQTSPASVEEPSNHAIRGESSLTPVQWEAWSLPTETWGHYESATDLAGGSCQDFTTTTPFSRVSPQKKPDNESLSSSASAAAAASPLLLADIGRRLASLPNLAEAEIVMENTKKEKKDTSMHAAGARRRKTATTGSTVPTCTSPESAAEATTPASTTTTPAATPSIEQVKIRTLQTEIHRLQSQLLNLQTTQVRTLKSSARYKSKCTTLQSQLDDAHAENDHLRQEVQDLKTLVKLEEEARLVGAMDALLLEEEDRSTTPPTQIEVEVPVVEPTVPNSLIKDHHTSSSTVLNGLEQHVFTNRVAQNIFLHDNVCKAMYFR